MRTALFTATVSMLVSPAALAQATFEPPQEITAGGSTFGEILYPSPVLFDVDGDGQRELIIGDLIGQLQSCEPLSSAAGFEWAAMKHLQCEGKPLRLHNW